MATISQIVAQIRTAIFGKDVRENIAQGIEQCYDELGNYVDDLIIIQQTQPSPIPSHNQIWLKPESEEYVVPTMDDVATVAETIEYLEIPQVGE